MCRESKSIYQSCRKHAGLTQETAAEALHISFDSLGDYERMETRIPCDLVIRMADLYGDPMLAYRHMTENCPVGKECLPKFEHREAPTAVLHLQKEMEDVKEVYRDLVSAACAGVAALSGTTKEVSEMVAAGMAYLFSGKKRTASVGSTGNSLRSKPV